MIILDCENIDNTYISIRDITGLKKEDIIITFKELKTQMSHSSKTNIIISNEDILHIFENEYKIIYNVDYVIWFHASRTNDTNLYNKGILSLPEITEDIWKFLYTLIDNKINHTDWDEFKNNFISDKLSHHNAYLYNFKMKDSFHWGPYGFLIKDLIFNPNDLGNWDYLGAPEIVYDICISFEEKYDIDLLKTYLNKTKPIIIKFRDKYFKPDYVGYALLYLYKDFINENIDISCNYCFAGGGKKIKEKDILSIEVINNWKSKYS